MIDELATQTLLGAFRGEPAVDRDQLVDVLRRRCRRPRRPAPTSSSVDVNPLIVGRRRAGRRRRARRARCRRPSRTSAGHADAARPTDAQFRALFEPRGRRGRRRVDAIPGKFGFVSLHNLLASGYQGEVFATNLEGEEVLGIQTGRRRRRAARRRGRPRVRVHAGRGQRRAAAGVRGEGHPGRVRHLGRLRRGRRARAGRRGELVALADELGILLAGPNGQGVVSTPANLCAQIVAPYPPAGRHRRGQPERQLRVELPELRPRRPASASAGPSAPATPPRSASPTTSTGTPTTPPPRSAWPTSRASPTGAACSSDSPRSPPASRWCW